MSKKLSKKGVIFTTAGIVILAGAGAGYILATKVLHHNSATTPIVSQNNVSNQNVDNQNNPAGNTTKHQLPINEIFVAPSKSLPNGVENRLTPYSKRVTPVSMMIISSAQTADGQKVNITGNSVLVISPSTAYAVSQFASIWDKLKIKPTVVWLNATATIVNLESK